MEPDDDQKAERGRKSPAVPLDDSIAHLGVIHTRLGLGPYGLDALAEALGHKSGVSGTARGKVGALTHFELLHRDGKAYKVSPVGKRILLPLSPEDKRAAVAEAACAPTLYAEVVRDYAGQALPQLLQNVLVHNHGVLSSTAPEVAANFRRSMEVAGLLRHGVLHSRLTDPPAAAPAAPAPDQAATNAGKDGPAPAKDGPPPAADPDAGLVDYRIPLTKRRSAVLGLPTPLDESDLARIKKWLDLMADVLMDPPEPAAAEPGPDAAGDPEPEPEEAPPAPAARGKAGGRRAGR